MSVESDTLIREEETEIRVSRQGGADYTEKRHTERLVYNTIRVPRGNEYHVVLSDNTEVWLNSESELRFPVNFVGGERRVFLKGEAFFAVERDTARPFFVEADEMRLEVLGTSFNVNAYRDNGNLLATLVEVVRADEIVVPFKPSNDKRLVEFDFESSDLEDHLRPSWHEMREANRRPPRKAARRRATPRHSGKAARHDSHTGSQRKPPADSKEAGR